MLADLIAAFGDNQVVDVMAALGIVVLADLIAETRRQPCSRI